MIEKNIYLSDKYNNYLSPEAVVWINDEKLSEKGIYFTGLEVDKSLDGADICSFSISDAIDSEFEPKNSDLFELGNTIEIHIGYADSDKKKSDLSILFMGIVTKVNWNFSEDNFLDISIEGHDYSFLLMKHQYKNVIRSSTISDIVNKIVGSTYRNLFTKSNIEPTTVIYPQMQIQEENDYLFIRSLADKNGYEFFIDNSTLHFRSPPVEQTSSITLRYGQEILGFKPEFNVEKEVSKVKVVGLEFSGDKKPIVGEASVKDIDSSSSNTASGIKALLKKLNRIEYEVREPVKTVEEAIERAQSILQNHSTNLFKGEVKSIGIPDLKPGITIALSGLGSRFSRDYYIEKTIHSFSDQGYETTVSVRGSANSFKKSG